MSNAPRLYRRGKRGTWWADLGEIGGIRQRRSTGETSETKAQAAALAFAEELRRHQSQIRLLKLTEPQVSGAWLAQCQTEEAALLWERIWKNAKGRAQRDGLVWALSWAELIEMVRASDGRCAVTGLSFAMVDEPRNPFKPSIDRKDNTTGYSRGNCRLTLMAVNYAMNVWGEQLFASIALSYASKCLQSEAHISHRQFHEAKGRA
jgi:hypothetical protein